MTPYYSKHNTDCLRACISSIIDIDISNFPWVTIEETLNNNWFQSLYTFLIEEYKISISHQKNTPSNIEYYISVYKDPHRELNYHAVVCNDMNDIIHNPSLSDDYDYKTLDPDYFIIITK